MAGSATTTVNFGTTPVDSGVFTITDANITATSYVEAFVMVDSTGTSSNTANDIEDHKQAAASFRLSTLPAAGSFTLYIDCLFRLCTGQFKIRYAWA